MSFIEFRSPGKEQPHPDQKKLLRQLKHFRRRFGQNASPAALAKEGRISDIFAGRIAAAIALEKEIARGSRRK